MGRRVSPALKKKRKQAIIDSLAEGNSLAQAERDANCPDSTNYTYRRDDPDYAEEVNRLLTSPEHRARIAQSQGVSPPPEMTAGERFLWYYEGSKDRVLSCYKAGIRPTELDKMLNSSSDKYDEDFAAEFTEQVRADEMRLEDIGLRQAIVQKQPSMVRFMLSGADKHANTTINVGGNAMIVSDKATENASRYLDDKFGNKSDSD